MEVARNSELTAIVASSIPNASLLTQCWVEEQLMDSHQTHLEPSVLAFFQLLVYKLGFFIAIVLGVGLDLGSFIYMHKKSGIGARDTI
jgi:hypothetical protein